MLHYYLGILRLCAYFFRRYLHLIQFIKEVTLIWFAESAISLSSYIVEIKKNYPDPMSKLVLNLESHISKKYDYCQPLDLGIRLNLEQHTSHRDRIEEVIAEIIAREEEKHANMRGIGFRIIDGTLTSAFGHMSHGLELLKMTKDLNFFGDDTLLCLQQTTANNYYMSHWSNHFTHYPVSDREATLLSQKFGLYVLGMDWLPLRDKPGLWGFELYNFIKRKHQKRFGEIPTLEPKAKSKEILDKWLHDRGYKRVPWFAVFHIREKKERNGRDYSNADSRTFMESIDYVIERGGLAILIGENQLYPIPEKYGFINYARCHEKSDELNIAILSLCKFLVGTSSGPLTVPPTFGIPILYTNNPRISLSFANKGFCIAKKVFDIEKSTIINFEQQEAFDLGIGLGAYGGRYKYLNNSAVEILEATKDLFNFIENDVDRSTIGQLGVSSKKEGMGMNFAPSFIEMNRHLF